MNLTPLFIFSLPRTGSTLTQRILVAHKNITMARVSELYLLLYHLYSLKTEGVYSRLGHELQVRAITDFCQGLPNGVDDYLAEIRTFVMRLYAKAAIQKDAKYFVDKTPGYHLVVEDIIQLFPEGKFIFLWRNPLAVVSSLNQTWTGGRWAIYRHQIFLFEGLANLIRAFEKYPHQVYGVRYEDLVTKPEKTWQQVFTYLELPFDVEILSGFVEVKFEGIMRDPHMDNKENQILRQDTMEKWKGVLANPIRKAWCRRYLRWIGSERLAVMGYDFNELLAELDNTPSSLRFLGSDMWWMPYDILYRIFEGRIMKHKIQDLRAGRRVYAHI
jgi:hypothetical protein